MALLGHQLILCCYLTTCRFSWGSVAALAGTVLNARWLTWKAVVWPPWEVEV